MRIVIPHKDRNGYLTICLATLFEAIRDHKDVQVTLYDNDSDYPLPPIVDDLVRLGDLSVLKLHQDNCHHVFIDMLNREFLRCDDEFIINMDSDCCVHPSFITAARQMIRDLPKLGHASLYSEGNHPEPGITVCNGKYHVRGHISMTASIISREAWAAFPKPIKGENIRFGCIDGAFSTFVHETRQGCFSTVRSYVEHIGAIGAYSNLTHDGASTCHRARRFDWRP